MRRTKTGSTMASSAAGRRIDLPRPGRVTFADAAFSQETGTFGQANRSRSDLWGGSARIWSYGADVSLPIFTAGAIAGQVDSAEAGQRAAEKKVLVERMRIELTTSALRTRRSPS